MRRTTLILIIVLVVLLAGGAALWLTGTEFSNPFSSNTTKNSAKNANTKNTNSTPVVTNTAPVNVNVPVVKGDTAFTGTVTINAVKVTISSLQRLARYNDITATAGNTVLMLFFDPVTNAQVKTVVDGISAGMKLEYQGGSADLRRYKVAGENTKGDHGFLLFTLPTNAAKIFLVHGQGPTAERLSIPAAK